MKRSTVVVMGFAILLLIALPAFGQNGCANSPENPTIVLALVGGAGALVSAARARLRALRRSSRR